VHALVLYVSILASAMTSTPSKASIEIMRTGSFHGDEVAAKAAGRWFALVLESDGASLRSINVSVASEHDSMVDNDGQKTGKRVESSPTLEAVILVRGLASLRAGRLPTAVIQQPVEPNHAVDARFGRGSYRLSVRCADIHAVGGQRQQECELRLESALVNQSLFSYSAYFQGSERYWASENPPTVVWAGDLDKDGRLDLLLNTSNHYNVSEMRLYLSSAAKAGHLVAEVASFRSVGC